MLVSLTINIKQTISINTKKLNKSSFFFSSKKPFFFPFLCFSIASKREKQISLSSKCFNLLTSPSSFKLQTPPSNDYFTYPGSDPDSDPNLLHLPPYSFFSIFFLRPIFTQNRLIVSSLFQNNDPRRSKQHPLKLVTS